MNAFELSSEIVDRLAALRPIAATYQGLAGYDHLWGDLGPSGGAANVSALEEFQRRAAALPASADRWERLAAQVMNEYLRQEMDWFEHGDHRVDLNNIASTFQSLREVFDVMDTSTPKGWENIVARLETLGQAAEGYIATLEEGRGRGQVVPRRQVLAGVKQARVHASPASFFHGMPGMLDASKVNSAGVRERLVAAIPGACGAFARLGDYLEKTYLPSARAADASGHERYQRNTRRFLGMDIDPKETYAWGWKEVADLEARMRAVAEKITPGAPLAETMKVLKTDPERAAPSPEAFAALMRERQSKALLDLDGVHFDIPGPIRQVEVKLAPPGGALSAYYVQPSEDFSRPGTVWYSLGNKKVVPLYDEISTAYHEGFPGHHLQCGVQVFLADRLSRLHRLSVWYPGYGEGWALYAEHLMGELGYFEKPEYVLGMLACQMLRACRVVIDIGSHLELPIPQGQDFHPGEAWSFDRGVEMLTTRAFLAPDVADSEMTRYLGWPGQAICYKVGQRAILDLREDLRRRKGTAFDLKDFHERVVGSGPVGLALLKELVLAEN